MHVYDVAQAVADDALVGDGALECAGIALGVRGIDLCLDGVEGLVVVERPYLSARASDGPRDRLAVCLHGLVGGHEQVIHVLHRAQVHVETHGLGVRQVGPVVGDGPFHDAHVVVG